MNIQEKWQKLFESYELGEYDNPENRDWYAKYFASKQILLDLGANWKYLERLNHQAVSWGCNDLRGFAINLRRILPSTPEKPKKRISWHSEPTNNTKERAREIFKTQFKKAFPRKRINSKFAKEKWEEVKDKALGMAEEEYNNDYLLWKGKEDVLKEEHAKKLKKWENDRAEIEHIHKIAEKLFKEVGI